MDRDRIQIALDDGSNEQIGQIDMNQSEARLWKKLDDRRNEQIGQGIWIRVKQDCRNNWMIEDMNRQDKGYGLEDMGDMVGRIEWMNFAPKHRGFHLQKGDM